MPPFTITPQGLAQAIMCYLLGPVAVRLNSVADELKNFPSLLKVINVLEGTDPNSFLTNDELNAAMDELYSGLNKRTDQNLNLTDWQKQRAKSANGALVGLVYNTIVSNLRLVRVVNVK